MVQIERLVRQSYTSNSLRQLLTCHARKPSQDGKELTLADRDMVETETSEVLRNADTERALGIPARIMHNASIMNAVGAYGP